MPAEFATPGASSGVAFLVSAGIVYEIVAASCSSPQTTEINADTRAETLMKWVYIGLAQAVLFVAVAAVMDRKNKTAIISGGVAAGGVMWFLYKHAQTAGLKNVADGLPGTES